MKLTLEKIKQDHFKVLNKYFEMDEHDIYYSMECIRGELGMTLPELRHIVKMLKLQGYLRRITLYDGDGQLKGSSYTLTYNGIEYLRFLNLPIGV